MLKFITDNPLLTAHSCKENRARQINHEFSITYDFSSHLNRSRSAYHKTMLHKNDKFSPLKIFPTRSCSNYNAGSMHVFKFNENTFCELFDPCKLCLRDDYEALQLDSRHNFNGRQ